MNRTEIGDILATAKTTGRIIGIMPRVGKKKDETPSPTTAAIHQNGVTGEVLEMDDEQAQIDFLLGRFPLGFRAYVPNDDLQSFPEHHIRRGEDGKPTEVPSAYDGLKTGDVAIVPFGGINYLPYALARRTQRINAHTLRVTPADLKAERDSYTGDASEPPEDSVLLVNMAVNKPQLVHEVLTADLNMTRLEKEFKARMFAQKQRIAIEQWMWQLFIGEAFCSDAGQYPEGSLRKDFDKRLLKLLPFRFWRMEESRADRRLAKALSVIPVYNEVLSPVDGIGPRIAGGIITTVKMATRFPNKWKFRKFMGVHCMPDGSFPRRRRGQKNDWNAEAREAMVLFGDSITYQKASEWGIKLRENKQKERKKHPVIIMVRKNLAWPFRSLENLCKILNIECVPHNLKVLSLQELIALFNERHAIIRVIVGENSKLAKRVDEMCSVLGGLARAEESLKPDDKKQIRLYTKGHIHKMGVKATLGQFTEWLHGVWTEFERTHQQG